VAGVRWWYGLSTTPLGDLTAAARLAEELGFEGVTLPYVLIAPAVTRSRYPYSPDGRAGFDPTVVFADPLVAVGAMAAATTRLRFCTNVHTAPVQDPFTLALAVGTAAVLSDDRFVFGVGSGWLREAFDVTGQPFAGRDGRLDEMVHVVRRLLTGEVVEHHGEHYDFEPLRLGTRTAVPVPIYGGGHSPRALDRAAGLDGWLGVVYDVDEAVRLATDVRRRRRARGLTEDGFAVVLGLRDDPTPADLATVAAAGVSDLWKLSRSFADPATRDWAHRRAELEQFAERYLTR
jgi:alkanesulfonate monooxygenase SsuD/methylene tetrahydromethanopterin reductase-like flavin-dependent oxidoreductase (luciferase family)